MNGVSVKVGEKVRGFIPKVHLQVKQGAKKSKTLEQQFPEGSELSCRVCIYVCVVVTENDFLFLRQVLKCVPNERKLVLTSRKAIVRSQLKVLTSVADATIGEQLDATIVAIRRQGVVVVFYNDVRGWVPRRQLSSDPIEFPEKVFYVGQVVRCRVKEVDADNPNIAHLVLSFIVSRTSFRDVLKKVAFDCVAMVFVVVIPWVSSEEGSSLPV